MILFKIGKKVGKYKTLSNVVFLVTVINILLAM